MATASTDERIDEALELRETERAVLVEEVAAFGETLKEPAARERYGRLGEAVATGTVPAALVPALEAMLELVLQTRRIRLRHGPEADEALSALFYRTPRGAGLRESTREVNAALKALRGQTLDQLTVMAGPGRHTFILNTDRCRLTLKIDRNGARIENVEVGG